MRRAYLQAMDIDVYYCRRALARAGAAPDYPAELPQSSELPSGPTQVAVAPRQQRTSQDAATTAAPKRRAASALDAPVPKPASTDKVTDSRAVDRQTQSASSESATRGSESGEPEVQFALRCYAPLASIGVIDEIPFARESRQDDGNSELLLAILRALVPAEGHASREQLLSAVNQSARELRYENIRWPLGSGLESGSRAAREMVLGFIKQRFAARGIRQLLLLSPQLCQLLPLQFGTGGSQPSSSSTEQLADRPEGEASDGLGRMGACRLVMLAKTAGAAVTATADDGTDSDASSVPPGQSIEFAVTATHSLTALQAYPSLKRETWMHLQALRHRLAE